MEPTSENRVVVPSRTYAYIALVVAISTFLELLRDSIKQQKIRSQEFWQVQNEVVGETIHGGRRPLGRRASRRTAHMAACRLLMTESIPRPPRVISCPWYIKPRTIEWFYLCIDWSPNEDPERFRQFFRVSPVMFHQICDIVRADLITAPPPKLLVLPNRKLIVERQVALALRRLATGDSILGIGELFGLSKATVSKCVWKFVKAFCLRGRQFLKWPCEERTEVIKAGFSERWGFPNCCGAIDVTHFLIELPAGENASAYYDWKHKLSVTMQAVVDSKCNFLDVFIGNPGSIQDARLLRTSALFRNVVYDESKLNGQAYRCIDGTRLPEYLLGDAGYPLYKWLIVPYTRGESMATDDWNHRHSSARMCVERAFGKLKGSWRILSRLIIRPKLERLARTIMACVLLHNMAAMRGEEAHPAVWADTPAHPPGYGRVQRPNNAYFEGGHEARDALFREVLPWADPT